jgi:amidase
MRLLLSIIADKPISAEAVHLAGLKAAFWLEEPTFALDPEVKTTLETFADRLTSSGVIVQSVKCPIQADLLMFTYTMLLYPIVYADLSLPNLVLYEALRAPAKLARALGANPLSWAQGILGATARHREWLKANEARARIGQALDQFFTRHDVLLAPVSPTGGVST